MADFDVLVVGDLFDAIIDGIGNVELTVSFRVGNLVTAFLPLAFEGKADEDNDEGEDEEDDDNDIGHVGWLQIYRIGGGRIGAGLGIGSGGVG